MPHSYVPGTAFTSTATFANKTISALGVTPGDYVFTWGTGANADSFTITTNVPEPSTWTLLGLGAGGLVWRRQRPCA